MSDDLFRFTVLGEVYQEVRDLERQLWRGDLIYFPNPHEPDVKCYMLQYNYQQDSFTLVNWIGYKAGAELVLASIPPSALDKNAQAVRIRWFKENWETTFLPFGSFETTKFLQWVSRA